MKLRIQRSSQPQSDISNRHDRTAACDPVVLHCAERASGVSLGVPDGRPLSLYSELFQLRPQVGSSHHIKAGLIHPALTRRAARHAVRRSSATETATDWFLESSRLLAVRNGTPGRGCRRARSNTSGARRQSSEPRGAGCVWSTYTQLFPQGFDHGPATTIQEIRRATANRFASNTGFE